jgi:hypothetical protein
MIKGSKLVSDRQKVALKPQEMTMLQKNQIRVQMLRQYIFAPNGLYFQWMNREKLDKKEAQRISLIYPTMIGFLTVLESDGAVTEEAFSNDGGEYGRKVLSVFLKEGDLVKVPGSSPTKVRLKDEFMKRPQEIMGKAFDNIWHTLQPTESSFRIELAGIGARHSKKPLNIFMRSGTWVNVKRYINEVFRDEFSLALPVVTKSRVDKIGSLSLPFNVLPAQQLSNDRIDQLVSDWMQEGKFEPDWDNFLYKFSDKRANENLNGLSKDKGKRSEVLKKYMRQLADVLEAEGKDRSKQEIYDHLLTVYRPDRPLDLKFNLKWIADHGLPIRIRVKKGNVENIIEGVVTSVENPEPFSLWVTMSGVLHKLSYTLDKNDTEGRIVGLSPSFGDKAQYGGIDLTPARMKVQVKTGSPTSTFGDDNGSIKFHLTPAMIEDLRNAPGFVPVIISVKPLADLQSFLCELSTK